VYGAEAERSFTGERWTCSDRLRGVINWIEAVDEPGLSPSPRRIHTGLNSGYQAIGLAYLWGARRIILLGYDMQRTGGRSHYHGDHEGGLGNLGTLPEWGRRMIGLGADLRARGVEVVNATRETALTCFERRPIGEALDPPRPQVWVAGMKGLGDNIYQRAVIRELAASHEVWLSTPWPQFYADLPVHCVRLDTALRTQARNVAKVTNWARPPRSLLPRQASYAGRRGTMLQGLCDALGVQPGRLTFDLPAFAGDRERPPYIVIRPATVRTEWPAASRNPLPEYLALAAEVLRRDFHIVSVADLVPGVEWPVLPLPYADERLHAGELGVEQLMALVAKAAGVVGGVGWLVPAAIAYRVPLFLIFGGWGHANGPDRIFDARIDAGCVTQARPDRFCGCDDRAHCCDKRIAGIAGQLERWRDQRAAVVRVEPGALAVAARVGPRLVPGERAAV